MAAPGDPRQAGWWPDPTGRFEHRYHNGTAWTGDVASGGQRYVDHALPPPTGASVAPGAAGSAGAVRNGIATAALTCGIVGAAIGWFPVVFVAGLVLSVLAIVFGVVGLGRARRRGVGRGFAITGIVTGLVGLPVAAVGAAFTVATYRAVERYLEPAPHTVELEPCRTEATDRGREVVVAGTIRNDGTATAAFNVEVRVERPGSGVALGVVQVGVDDVEPGASRRFEVRRAVRTDAVECRVGEVTGPLPFGIDPG